MLQQLWGRPPSLHPGLCGPSRTLFAQRVSHIRATVYVPHLPAVRELAADSERESGGSVAGFASSAASLVHDRFRYEKGATHVQSSIEDALRKRAGVCRNFAHLLLAILRMRGLPARYVSGYRCRTPLPSREPAPRKSSGTGFARVDGSVSAG
jgi:transglutaminase-like putative cysteine protease